MNPRPQNPDPFFSSKSQFLDDEYKYVQAFLAALTEQRDKRIDEIVEIDAFTRKLAKDAEEELRTELGLPAFKIHRPPKQKGS